MKTNLLTKMLGGFILVAAIIVILGIFSIIQMNSIHHNVETFGNKLEPSIYTIGEVKLAIGHYRRQQILHVLYTNQKDKSDTEVKITADDVQINKFLDDFSPMATSAEEQALVNKVKTVWETYTPAKRALPGTQ